MIFFSPLDVVEIHEFVIEAQELQGMARDKSIEAIIGRIDQVPHLSGITCPTVVVCGEQDQITPIECAREMAGKIRDAELAVLAECGHMSTMEKPEAVSGILHDWLSRA